MMRTTGFLAGVCLTVATLLLVLDKLEDQQQEPMTGITEDATAEQLSGVIAAIAEQVDVVPDDDIVDETVASAHESGTAESELSSSLEASGPHPDKRPEVAAEAPADGSDHEHSGNAGTYQFWSPFRSEWAAQGFAGRLTSATQVAVEVVHAGPGKYRVAFSYRDETERLAQIEHIETITGLKLE